MKVALCFCLVIFLAPLEILARRRKPSLRTNCELKSLRVPIERNGCRSKSYVEVKYCDGNCYSMTSYTPEYPYYKSHCHCCKAYKERARKIELECPPDANGVIKTVPHYVPDILECKCKKCEGHK
uniref:CTCK domain-containing protein n=1 Tax=Clytia hemisphaerica TaxID=252671 RepID=A0A7M5TYN1_9CNID